MAEIQYKSNSHKSKEEAVEKEKKEIKTVTTGSVVRKSDSLSKKFADTFFGESVGNVGEYLVNDVFIPAVKDTLVDLIDNGIRMLAYGSPTGRRSNGRNGSKTNYSSYSSYSRVSSNNSRNERTVIKNKSRYGFDNLTFSDKEDALDVKECVEEICDHYDMITIAEFLKLAGLGDEVRYTDNSWGWYGLKDIGLIRTRDGYQLDIPKPEPID